MAFILEKWTKRIMIGLSWSLIITLVLNDCCSETLQQFHQVRGVEFTYFATPYVYTFFHRIQTNDLEARIRFWLGYSIHIHRERVWTYLKVLKISIKNFKGILLNPMEWTQGHSARDLGLLMLKEMWWVKVLRCHHLFLCFFGHS